MKLSIVIPVFNEELNVGLLHQEVVLVCKSTKQPYEIIFVNDGSTDRTRQELEKLHPVTIINLRRNFGQTAAFDAGIKHASGDVIITMDGDGQNDPADIPMLIEKLKEGFDAVSGWRWQRKDSLSKRFISWGAYTLRQCFIRDNIHDSGCSLKVYRRQCFEGLDLNGEMHRFIPAVLDWQGFLVTEVKVNHRPRSFGRTKYTFSRTFKGFLDILALWFWRRYSMRPLHLFGGAGFILIVTGGLFLITLFFMRMFEFILLKDSVWPLVSFFTMLVGVQLFVAGLLADISMKSYYKTSHLQPYAIKDVIIHE